MQRVIKMIMEIEAETITTTTRQAIKYADGMKRYLIATDDEHGIVMMGRVVSFARF